MKRIQLKLLISLSILLFFVLTIFNSFSISKSFDQNEIIENFREIQLINSELKSINLDFLLDYKDITVIAIYDDMNRGIYDPRNVLDRFTLLSENGRYFNFDDYLKKTDVKIKVIVNEAENDESIDVIATARVFTSMELKSHYMFNLLARQGNIQKLIVFGEQQDQIVNKLVKLGLHIQDPPYYSIPSLLDTNNNTNKIITMIIIFFYSCIVFTVIDIVLQFIKYRKTIAIHFLNGMSIRMFLVKYVVTFTLKVAVLFIVLPVVYRNFIWVYRINNQLLYEILISLFIIINIVYAVTAYTTYKSVEVLYDVH